VTEPLGARDFVHASGALTGGAFELFEVGCNAGDGPPLHVHAELDEAFYVLEGKVGFWCDDKVIEAERGQFVFVPRRSVHRFEGRVDGSRVLFVVAPAGLEGYFRERLHMMASGADPVEAMMELAQRYDAKPIINAPK
jgi:mannose-6-phosphate isomerase-like protein (cupin superfamily)